jgi:HIV Tat-specific factor 1
VAEDGKEYVFDEETKKWVTPQQKIQDDLDALREAAEDDGDGKHYRNKHTKVRAPPKAPPLPVAAAAATTLPSAGALAKEDPSATTEAEILAALGDGVEKGGGTDAETAASQEKKRKKKKKKNDKWKRAKTNTWVYVNGLPLDVTIQEVHDHFAKCGVIQTDLATETPRIKLYTNKDFGGLNVSGSTLVVSVVCWL